MGARDECKALDELAGQLCAEFGYPLDTSPIVEEPTGKSAREVLFGPLSLEDERLIAAARRALTRIATALRARFPASTPVTTLGTLLDGAELVMREELTNGNRPAAVLPSVVFLIAIPAVEQDEALELSQRATSILGEALD